MNLFKVYGLLFVVVVIRDKTFSISVKLFHLFTPNHKLQTTNPKPLQCKVLTLYLVTWNSAKNKIVKHTFYGDFKSKRVK